MLVRSEARVKGMLKGPEHLICLANSTSVETGDHELGRVMFLEAAALWMQHQLVGGSSQ